MIEVNGIINMWNIIVVMEHAAQKGIFKKNGQIVQVGFILLQIRLELLQYQINKKLPDEIIELPSIENKSDKEVKYTVKYPTKKGYSTNWNSTFSTGLKMGIKLPFGVKDIAGGEFSTEASIGTSESRGENTSRETTLEQSAEVTVPPRSRVRVAVATERTGSSIEYFLPLSLEGKIMCYKNDSDNSEILDINDPYFDSFRSSIFKDSGLINISKISKTKLIVHEPEKL